jgi:hypothetical protein
LISLCSSTGKYFNRKVGYHNVKIECHAEWINTRFAFSQQVMISSLGYLRITYYNLRFRCNHVLYYHKLLERSAIHCGQGDDHKFGESDVIDQTILTAFDEYSFLSMQNLAKRTCIPPTTVWRWLTHFIGFVVKHLC